MAQACCVAYIRKIALTMFFNYQEQVKNNGTVLIFMDEKTKAGYP